jgi:hypothetical protein
MWSDAAGTPETRSGTVGLAWLERICTTFKYSIAEDTGGFSNIIVKYFIFIQNKFFVLTGS